MSHWASTWAYEQPIKLCGRKFVLVALASFADEDGYCYPGQETLAGMTGQDARSVRRHLLELEKSGFIKRKHRYDEKKKKRTSDGYHLLAPAERLNPYRTDDPVTNRTDCPPDRLSRDLSDHKVDPSVKKDPPVSPKGSYRKPVKPPPEPELDPPYSGTEFTRALTNFENHRREMKRPLTPTSRRALYGRLETWGEEMAIEALVEVVEKGWIGPVAPRSQAGRGNGHRPAAVEFGDVIEDDGGDVYFTAGPDGSPMYNFRTAEAFAEHYGFDVEKVKAKWN